MYFKCNKDDTISVLSFFLPIAIIKVLKEINFMEVCQKTTMAHSPFGMANPLEKAMQEYSFDGRHNIPNLLSRQYALR